MTFKQALKETEFGKKLGFVERPLLLQEEENEPTHHLRLLARLSANARSASACDTAGWSGRRRSTPSCIWIRLSSLRAGLVCRSDLIEACTERGIEISFLSFSGKPYAKLNSPSVTATVISRREQLAAYHDERGVEIAKRSRRVSYGIR